MKGIETGKDKVKKICDALRRETLEPAMHEAEEIIRSAKESAQGILESAHKQAAEVKAQALGEIERQKNVFQSSLTQACKQTMEALRQSIEERLLHRELASAFTKHTQDPKVLSSLIEAVIKGLEKEGVDADLSVYIPAAVPARTVNEFLGSKILEKLREKSVLLGPLTGGIELKVHGENITVDISDVALRELVANYIRKDFRKLIFEV